MRTLLTTVLCTAIWGASIDSPTGPRMTPPTLNSISPVGIARGTTVEMTVEGLNLARASAVYFSEPAVKGTILRVKELPDLPDIRLGSNGTPSTVDVGPLPPRNQVTVEVDVSPDAPIGPVSFRLLTPLGTSPEGRLLIEPYYGESGDREPDDTAENAVETYLPAILTGAISKPGDEDWFKINVTAPVTLTFENGATQVGSTLQPLVSILDADQRVLKEYGAGGGRDETLFAHRFEKPGTYYVRVGDFQQSGRASHFYRIKIGSFPLATAAYPLGLERAKQRSVALSGYHLKNETLNVTGKSTGEDEDLVLLRPPGAFNKVALAIGDDPEVDAAGGNTSIESAQAVTAPVTVNGRLDTPAKSHFFRFHASKGEKLVIDADARRLGSPLDSVLDVFDAKGAPVERATVRCTWETSTTLSERDSASRGIRLLSWTGLEVGDYLMVGGEIIRVQALPNGPDEDTLFESFGGQRIAYFDTTTEAHAVDKPVYKIQVHPPGAKFTPNGLPLVRLYFRNDDGGPGYGKDSLVHFTAPADGDYVVRLSDVRGAGGADFAYRLAIHSPRPDFRLTVNPRNPNVPAGGCIPLTVTAMRRDEFDGPIHVELTDLPPGLKATAGTIAAGQTATTLLLSADAGATLPQAVPLRVKGTVGNIVRFANPDDRLKLIAVTPKPDVITESGTQVVEIEPGGKAQVAVRIVRQNGFGGRVPIEVRNLPPRVRVTDVGLNGVLINEDEDHRSFTIEALPNAAPVEQKIYLSGLIETRSSQQNSYAAPTPILLRVRAVKR
jgi:hypothetical protein